MASPIDPVEKRRKGPSPLLFYIMLGIIVGGVLIFLVLSRSHSGGVPARRRRPLLRNTDYCEFS